MDNRPNLLLATDAYKGGHYLMHPADVDATKFYVAPRAPISAHQREFIVFGFRYFVENYLKNPITQADYDEAVEIWDEFMPLGKPYPFPKEQFRKLIGKPLPISIFGVAEGTVLNTYNVPVAIVECLDKDYYWLPGFLETAFQRAIWYPSTVGTISRNVKKFLKECYKRTVDEKDAWSLEYRLHDFGARGVGTGEGAGIGGLAHLINFQGTDTMEAVRMGIKLYGGTAKDYACSIPAAEHSTVTMHGPHFENEKAALIQMIRNFGGGPFSFVSDSYDYRRFVDEAWCDPVVIKALRDRGGVGVIRPDSGDPVREPLYALRQAEKAWGFDLNGKGFKVLRGVAVIQGDGMEPKTIRELYEAAEAEKFAANNIVIGMGGGLLQKLNRDTMKWSMKLYQARRNGTWVNVQKKPATAADKIGWNPQNGVNLDGWVCYYGKNTFNLPLADADFKAVRARAAV